MRSTALCYIEAEFLQLNKDTCICVQLLTEVRNGVPYMHSDAEAVKTDATTGSVKKPEGIPCLVLTF